MGALRRLSFWLFWRPNLDAIALGRTRPRLEHGQAALVVVAVSIGKRDFRFVGAAAGQVQIDKR